LTIDALAPAQRRVATVRPVIVSVEAFCVADAADICSLVSMVLIDFSKYRRVRPHAIEDAGRDGVWVSQCGGTGGKRRVWWHNTEEEASFRNSFDASTVTRPDRGASGPSSRVQPPDLQGSQHRPLIVNPPRLRHQCKLRLTAQPLSTSQIETTQPCLPIEFSISRATPGLKISSRYNGLPYALPRSLSAECVPPWSGSHVWTRPLTPTATASP
jgi:hypothetical protein